MCYPAKQHDAPAPKFETLPANAPPMPTVLNKPATPAQVAEALRQLPRLLPRAGGSKPALSTPPSGVAALDLAALTGVLEYTPDEYTFTALAGTPLAEVQALLARHNQYLPFDPPFAARGATLGGALASGLNGPGRWRFGGLRDFILGVQFVSGAGELARAGGRVVKNAAGFDLPKLLVGSLGRLAVLTEVTFKVFPAPPAYCSLRFTFPDLAAAVAALLQAAALPMDLDALDLQPPATLWARLAGLSAALPGRAARLQQALGGGTLLEGAEEQAVWNAAREFAWAPAGSALLKVPLTPLRIAAFAAALPDTASSRYSAGGQVCWLAWPSQTLPLLDELLRAQQLSALLFGGTFAAGEPALRGQQPGAALLQRAQSALDPDARFLRFD
ncbi:MAG: FAD-binding protein [Chloroflexi bacterium]|nr:MAG: FAD-binding protein [Chloroflexota bacterium]